MSDSKLLTRYNYDEFIPEKFEPWRENSVKPLDNPTKDRG